MTSLEELSKTTGITLSRQQQRSLNESKTTVLFLSSLNEEVALRAATAGTFVGAGEAYVVIKTPDGSYDMSRAKNLYYSEKDKTILTVTSEGDLIALDPNSSNP